MVNMTYVISFIKILIDRADLYWKKNKNIFALFVNSRHWDDASLLVVDDPKKEEACY